MPDPVSVAIYTRVSTAEQAQGHSLDSQRDALRAWAGREGWVVRGVFEDAGVSGTSVAGRPQFQRMIAAAEAGQIDSILVKSRSRYARNLGDVAITERLLTTFGVRVLSLDEPAGNAEDPSGFLMRGFSDLLAAHYSVELSHKVSQGYRKRAEKGLTIGDVPFGYTRASADQRIVPVADQAEAVRGAFVAYATGGVSMSEVADRLNAAGFAPRSKRGNAHFGQATIEGMLANRVYCGDVTYKGEVVVADAHPAIVERELYERVQRVRSERTKRPRTYGKHRYRDYLLSGTGICAECAGRLWAHAHTSGAYHYYRCSAGRRGVDCGHRGKGVRAELVEAEIGGMILDLRLPRDWREIVEARSLEHNDAEDVERERRRLKERIARAGRALLDGLVDYDSAKTIIREAESAMAGLPASKPPVGLAEAAGTLNDIPELWPHMTQAERREFVRMTMEYVAVELGSGKVAGMAPRDQFAPLFQTIAETDGAVALSTWRPRPDSNRRPRP